MARRRAFRLPSGESALTRLTRVKGLIEVYKAGGEPSKKLIIKALIEYYDLAQSLWLWGLKKK